MQEHAELGQHQVEDRELEDEAIAEGDGHSATRDRDASLGARGHH
jgi:hypothetical protein